MLNCCLFMGASNLTQSSSLEHLIQAGGGYVTHRAVVQAHLDPHLLGQAVRRGLLERLQRGVYRATTREMTSHEDLLEVSLRLPYAVVCLESALAFHGLTTANPKCVHLAVPRTRRVPSLEYPPLEVYHFSPPMYGYGIEHQGGFRVYRAEKTLADLLRWEKRVGLELFLEGLKRYLTRPHSRPDFESLLEAARVCKVELRMRQALEVSTFDLST